MAWRPPAGRNVGYRWWDKPGWLPYGLGTDPRPHVPDMHPHQSSSLGTCGAPGCGEQVYCYPVKWDEELGLEYGTPGVCEAHCPDHEYVTESRETYCVSCGHPPPHDYYD